MQNSIEEQSRQFQEDELDVLQAIYGEELRVSTTKTSTQLAIRIPPQVSCSSDSLLHRQSCYVYMDMSFKFEKSYPLKAKLNYQIEKTIGIPDTSLASIIIAIDQMINDDSDENEMACFRVLSYVTEELTDINDLVECSICFEPLITRASYRLGCWHGYHCDCFARWCKHVIENKTEQLNENPVMQLMQKRIDDQEHKGQALELQNQANNRDIEDINLKVQELKLQEKELKEGNVLKSAKKSGEEEDELITVESVAEQMAQLKTRKRLLTQETKVLQNKVAQVAEQISQDEIALQKMKQEAVGKTNRAIGCPNCREGIHPSLFAQIQNDINVKKYHQCNLSKEKQKAEMQQIIRSWSPEMMKTVARIQSYHVEIGERQLKNGALVCEDKAVEYELYPSDMENDTGRNGERKKKTSEPNINNEATKAKKHFKPKKKAESGDTSHEKGSNARRQRKSGNKKKNAAEGSRLADSKQSSRNHSSVPSSLVPTEAGKSKKKTRS